jgi:hypothetical protein
MSVLGEISVQVSVPAVTVVHVSVPAGTGIHSSPCITPFAITVAIGVIDALAPAIIPPRQ